MFKSFCDLDWLKNDIIALSINCPGIVDVLKRFSNHYKILFIAQKAIKALRIFESMRD